MADDKGNPLSGITNLFQGTASSKTADKTLTEVQGVSNSVKSIDEQLNTIIELLTGISSNAAESLSSNAADAIKKATGGKAEIVGDKNSKENSEDESGGGEEDDKKTSKVASVKPNDLANLSAKYSLGPILIWSKLDEIQKAFMPFIRQISKTGDAGAIGALDKDKDKKDEKSDGMKLKDINPDTVKKLGTAMIGFAKACIILSLVPKKPAAEAMSFLGQMLSDLDKATKDIDADKFDKMTKAMVRLDEALMKFGLACVILTITLPFQLIATAISLPLMELFIKGVIKVSKDAEGAMKNFDTFAMAMIKLGFAFLLFGASMFILSKVTKLALDALVGFAIILLVMTVCTLIGLLSVYLQVGLVPFAGAMIQLALAFILFGVAMMVLKKIDIKPEEVNEKVGMILSVVKSVALSAFTLIPAVFGIALLSIFMAVFAVTMILSLVAFGALFVTEKIMNGLTWVNPKDGSDMKGAPGGIPKVLYNALQIGNYFVDHISDLAKAIAGVLLFAVFTVFLTIASILLIVSFGVLFLSTLLFEAMGMITVDGKEVPKGIAYAGMVAIALADNALVFGLGILALIPGLIFAVGLTAFSILLAVSFGALLLAVKAADKIGDGRDARKIATEMRSLMIDMMCGILGVDHKDGETPGIFGMIQAGKNAIAMAALGLVAAGAIAPVVLFFLGLRSIGESVNKLSESLAGIKPETVKMVFGLIGQILGQMEDVGESFKGTSAKAVKAIGSLVKDVATAISMLTDTVLKLKDGIPEEQIQAACLSILRICQGLFGNPNEASEGTIKDRYTLTDLFATLAGSKLKKLKADALSALVPLIESIDKLADLVVKVGNPNTFSEEIINRGAANIQRFAGLVGNYIAPMFMSLVKKEGGFLGIGGTNPLEAVNAVNESDFFGKLSIALDSFKNTGEVAGGILPEKWNNLLAVLSKDWAKAYQNAEVFGNVLDRIDDGLAQIKSSHIDNLDKFLKVINQPLTNMQSNVKVLSDFANKADEFEKIGKSFKGMADAFGDMAKNSKKVGGLFDKMAKMNKENAETLAKSTENVTGAGDFYANVQDIHDVIMFWAENGVQVSFKQVNGTANPSIPYTGMASSRTGL